MRTVRYLEGAEAELLAEIGYLEERAEGLGRRFFDEVKRAERFIAEFIYSIEPDELLIIAIAHHSRRPDYWANRPGPRDLGR